MIVGCLNCGRDYDDEFRWSICPHETFAANDGQNNFEHHPESYLGPAPRSSLTEAYNLSPQWPLNMSEEFKQGFLAAISAYRTAIKKLRDDK
jgi:hypothetical protein